MNCSTTAAEVSIDPPPSSPDPIQQRLSALERENAQLRADVQDMTRLGVGQPVLPPRAPNAPFFRPLVFQRRFVIVLLPLMAPMFLSYIAAAILQAPQLRSVAEWHIGSTPLFDFGGKGTHHPGLGLGLIAWGGASFGVFAIGGLGIGLIATGGASVGVIAIGGGACGVIAIGGGAIGLIAMGGGARGYYALGTRGNGKYVFAVNRQDPAAVEFFTRYFPSLRESVSSPMPVIRK